MPLRPSAPLMIDLESRFTLPIEEEGKSRLIVDLLSCVSRRTSRRLFYDTRDDFRVRNVHGVTGFHGRHLRARPFVHPALEIGVRRDIARGQDRVAWLGAPSSRRRRSAEHGPCDRY